MKPDFDRCPVDYMKGGLERYVMHGIEPGSFLSAVICNDLREAFGCADEANTTAMHAWVRWFYNEAPGGCWGSRQRMDAWTKAGGLLGNATEAA